MILVIQLLKYKLDTAATERYVGMKVDNQAVACGECGKCEKLCPQNIPIIKRLKETTELFQESINLKTH